MNCVAAFTTIEFLSDPTVGEVRIGGAAPFIDEMIPAVIARLANCGPLAMAAFEESCRRR
jgi:hypothetical protein